MIQQVPTLALLDGVRIQMFVRGEHPPPHIHVFVSGQQYTIDLHTLKQRKSDNLRLAPHVRRKLLRWTAQHQAALLDCWQSLTDGKDLDLAILERLRNN